MINVCLIDPKFPRNVGEVLRTSSAYGVEKLYMTGSRVPLEGDGKKYRLPREERLRGNYGRVWPTEKPFNENQGLVPVAVELIPSAENLHFFEHPENALYVFGPEDGTLRRGTLGNCHRFVYIPSRSCLNLAQAVSTVLYDRHHKRVTAGIEEPLWLESAIPET